MADNMSIEYNVSGQRKWWDAMWGVGHVYDPEFSLFLSELFDVVIRAKRFYVYFSFMLPGGFG